jgi:zinc transport system substrate-binding protein
MLTVFLAPISTLKASGPETDNIKVFVSIIPQVYFVERIGGEHVDVEVLVGPGQSPATYEPTPKQMSKLGKSNIYFRIGVPFEKALIPKISSAFDDMHIVDTRAGVELRYFRQSKAGQVPDPHIWLDPKRVKVQAETIRAELSRIDPDHAGVFQRNCEAFQADLDRIDSTIAQILKPLQGSRIYVFHPAFGYFAQSYGLEQVAVEVEGKEPSARQLSSLINKARAENVKIIFVQPQYSKRNAHAIAQAIGGAVVPIDPLPRDYLSELENMASVIRDSFAENK